MTAILRKSPPRKRGPNSERKIEANRQNKLSRRKLRLQKGVWPARSKKYRTFIGQQPCCVPWCICRTSDLLARFLRTVECAHVGPHGMNQKSSDFDCVPLCHYQHQEAKDAQGKNRADVWFTSKGIDLKATQERLLAEFDRLYPEGTK